MSLLCLSAVRPVVFACREKAVHGFRIQAAAGADGRAAGAEAAGGVTLEEVVKIEGFADPIKAVAEGPRGVLIVACLRSLFAYNPKQAEQALACVEEAHEAVVSALHCHAASGLLFSGDAGGTFKAWRVKGRSISPVATATSADDEAITELQCQRKASTSLVFSLNGKTIRVWRLGGGFAEVAVVKDAHARAPHSLQLDPGSGRLVSADSKSIKVWQFGDDALEALAEVKIETKVLSRMCFDGTTGLVLGVWDRTVRAWRLEASSKGLALRDHVASEQKTKKQRHLQFDPRSGLVLTSPWDGSLVQAWRLEVCSQVAKEADPCGPAPVQPPRLSLAGTVEPAHAETVHALLLAESSRVVLSGGSDGTVKMWRLGLSALVRVAESEALTPQDAPRDCIYTLQFDASSGIVVSAGLLGAINVWRLEDPVLDLVAANVWRLENPVLDLVVSAENCHMGAINSVQFDAPSGLVVSAGCDFYVKVWRLEGRELRPVAEVVSVGPAIRTLQFDVASSRVFIANDAGDIKTFSFDGCSLTDVSQYAKAHESCINALRLDLPGHKALSGDVAGTIKLWGVTDERLNVLSTAPKAHPKAIQAFNLDPVAGLALSTDGELASVFMSDYSAKGNDFSMKLWSYKTGFLHEEWFPAITLSPATVLDLADGVSVCATTEGNLTAFRLGWLQRWGVVCTITAGASMQERYHSLFCPLKDYASAAVSTVVTALQLLSCGYTITIPVQEQVQTATTWLEEVRKVGSDFDLPTVPFVGAFWLTEGVILLFVLVVFAQEYVEDRKFLAGGAGVWSYLFVAMEQFVAIVATSGLLPLLNVLMGITVCNGGQLAADPSVGCLTSRHLGLWLAPAALALLSLLWFVYRLALVDFNLVGITVTWNPFDTSGDARVGDGARPRLHPLATYSVKYDAAVLAIKVLLSASLPFGEAGGAAGLLVCASAELVAGAALLAAGLVFQNFFEVNLPGEPALPLGLQANALQTAFDAAVAWQRATAFVGTLSSHLKGADEFDATVFTVMSAMCPVAMLLGYCLRRRRRPAARSPI